MEELRGASVLLLEDEFLIALDAEEILKGLGVGDVCTACTLADAERLVQAHRFDVAVFDVNINGQTSLALAEKLIEAGTPVLFATGYGMRGRAFSHLGVCVSKPYTPERFRLGLAQTLRREAFGEASL
ncbi:MAG TPA: response regulator [Caulobacterales bacterium]|nr:response regulator [Caulobacterales bacterium]